MAPHRRNSNPAEPVLATQAPVLGTKDPLNLQTLNINVFYVYNRCTPGYTILTAIYITIFL